MFFSVGFVCLSLAALAISYSEPALPKLDFKRSVHTRALLPRAEHVSTPLIHTGVNYLANITLGTPPQAFEVLVDTGSSDLWVQAPGTAWCKTNYPECNVTGTFNANTSSSYHNLSRPFLARYGIGLSSGVFSADVLQIGNAQMPNFIFGLATKVTANQNSPGILGVSLPNSEYDISHGTGPVRPTVLDALVSAGLIERRAFSLYLNDQQATLGSVLFGGVDHSKYTGPLTSYAMTPNATGDYERYQIAMTGVNFTDDRGNTASLSSRNMLAPTILDSGTSTLLLPAEVASAIINGFGAISELGLLWVNCAYFNSTASLSFQFGGAGSPSYKCPITQLITPYGGHLTFENGEKACQLNIAAPSTSADQGVYILGTPFLSNVYTVFDQDALEISLAQAIWDKTGQGSVNGLVSGTAAISGVEATYVVTPTAITLPIATVTASGNSSASASGSAAETIAATNPVFPTNPRSATFSLETTGTFAAAAASTLSGSASASASASGIALPLKADMGGLTVLTGLLALAGLM